jgi:hypothetical protein
VGYSARRNEDEMASIRQAMAMGVVTILSACGAPSSDPKVAEQGKPATFTYAPTLDKPYRETNRRSEEMSFPGTPTREAEQWTLEWQVVVTKETNLFKRSLRLVGLKINVNGVELLRGNEVQPKMATVDVLTDKDSNVVDVRGADQLSEAIAALGDENSRAVLARTFSAARLKALAVVRSQELHLDFIGRPTPVGSQWIATDPSSRATREIKVAGEEPCGDKRCLHVTRQYDLDGQLVFSEVSARVAAYVQAQGGDPTKIALAGVDLKLEDSLLIDPATMEYHGARFNQDATLRVTAPNGELPVLLKVRREVDYKY